MKAGRHFLQIPGPTNVPDEVLHASAFPTIDHRGQDFARLGREVLGGLRKVFRTDDPVIIFPASGTGAWEAALVNTLSPGDRVLLFETGHFSSLWSELAQRLGLQVDVVPGDWRTGADAEKLRERLRDDTQRQIKAVAVVHNETSTGVTSHIPPLRRALDDSDHPALLLVDTISSLGSIDYHHRDFGVDVTIAGSQKGLMLPPGLSFNAISEKALQANADAALPRSYWDWGPMLTANADGFFPYTPATNLLYGLKAAIDLLLEEGLEQVFARHARHATAARAAVEHWGLEIVATIPEERSNALTAVMLPEGHDADELRRIILDNVDISLGAGLAKLKGKVFRIGHLGDFNDPMLLGTLAGIEAGLTLADIPFQEHGVSAAIRSLVTTSRGA